MTIFLLKFAEKQGSTFVPTLCLNIGDKCTICKLYNKILPENREYQGERNRFDCAIDNTESFYLTFVI